MKSIRLTYLLVVSCLLFSYVLPAQISAEAVVRKEVVMEVPAVDLHKTLPEIKNALRKIEGISFEGFCNSKKLLMVRTTEDALFQLMMVMKDQHLIYYVKKQATIEAAKNACGDNREIDESFSIE